MSRAYSSVGGKKILGTPRLMSAGRSRSPARLRSLSRLRQRARVQQASCSRPPTASRSTTRTSHSECSTRRGISGHRPADLPQLRHTAASLAVQPGGNVKTVQNMLPRFGDHDAGRYAGLFDTDAQALADRMDEARERAISKSYALSAYRVSECHPASGWIMSLTVARPCTNRGSGAGRT